MQQTLQQLQKAVTELTAFNAKLLAKIESFSVPIVAEAKVDLTLVHAKLDKIGEFLAKQGFKPNNSNKTNE